MRILIAEDEPALTEVLRRGLSGEGFVVDVVHDGREALWAATEHRFDAIILDIMLPGLNGYKVLENLRVKGVWTPILMLTAKDGEYDEADAFDLGADDYLTKPFSFVVLIARLRSLIRRGSPERPAVFTVGDLTLDPTRRRVERAGSLIRLTAKEFALLEYLMHRAEEVVTKTQILDAVWDPAFDGAENIVEVYIGYLRRKIDAPFGLTTLHTMRGLGYRLDADT